MNINCQKLSWDSEFFGFSVGRLTSSSSMNVSTSDLVRSMDNDMRLAYFSAPQELSSLHAEGFELRLVDKKVTFIKKTEPVIGLGDFVQAFDPVFFQEQQLIELAIQSGIYSRFNVDPYIAKGDFERLYALWMQNSVRKIIAREVLVATIEGVVVGCITLGEKNGCGDIGIIAVNEDYRGRGFGRALMMAAEDWFFRQGFNCARVVTQTANEPAMGLYLASGYQIETIEYFYHIWRK
jgi:dTDP-4-amino-4,6-dideoxy-D-galactose acyltransferase